MTLVLFTMGHADSTSSVSVRLKWINRSHVLSAWLSKTHNSVGKPSLIRTANLTYVPPHIMHFSQNLRWSHVYYKLYKFFLKSIF
jgi:hypothetical protein